MNKIKNNKGFTVIEVAFALLIVAVAVVSIYTITKHTETKKTVNNAIPAYVPTNNYTVGVKLNGTITSDECVTSGIPIGDVGCYIDVNNSLKIYVKNGNVVPTHPWGSVINFNFGHDQSGKAVTIYAHQLSKTQYTLEGSSNYYVKITN
jgi:prepilin-type N-terminal cleavage/methylation domain-containing protein